MSTLTDKDYMIRAESVSFTVEEMILGLNDGRTVLVPLSWFPRLLHASPLERMDWKLLNDGIGIHWPSIDEDLWTAQVTQGVPSRETIVRRFDHSRGGWYRTAESEHREFLEHWTNYGSLILRWTGGNFWTPGHNRRKAIVLREEDLKILTEEGVLKETTGGYSLVRRTSS